MALLKIDDIKPLGAFIENTVRPMLAELKECGVDLKIESIEPLMTKLAIAHVFSMFISALRDIIVVCIIGYIICTTSL